MVHQMSDAEVVTDRLDAAFQHMPEKIQLAGAFDGLQRRQISRNVCFLGKFSNKRAKGKCAACCSTATAK